MRTAQGGVVLALTLALSAGCGGGGSGTAADRAIHAPVAGQPVVGLVATRFGIDAPPEPGSDHEEIARDAGDLALSGDTETCKESYDPSFLLLFKGARCTPSPGIEVLDIRLGAGLDNASATVVHHGGPLDMVTGTWEFLKIKTDNPPGLQPDHRWVVALWDIDYIRSRLLADVAPSRTVRGPDDALVAPAVQDCVRRVVKKLPDDDLVGFLSEEYDYGSGSRLATLMKCSQAAGASAEQLRREYYSEFLQLDTFGWAGEDVRRCGAQALVRSWDDRTVLHEAATDSLDLSAELNARIQTCLDAVR